LQDLAVGILLSDLHVWSLIVILEDPTLIALISLANRYMWSIFG